MKEELEKLKNESGTHGSKDVEIVGKIKSVGKEVKM